MTMKILDSFDLEALLAADSDAVKKIKNAHYKRFLEIGLPNRKSESYQYEMLSPLYETLFVSRKEQALRVQVEPNESAIILPLSQAYRTYGALLQNATNRALQENNNPFSLLNGAMYQDAVFIYVPPKKSVTLEVVSHLDSMVECPWIMPRVYLFQGASSSVRLVHTKEQGASSSLFYNSVFDIMLEENAELFFDQVSDESGWFFEHIDCTLKRSSRFKATFADTGSWMRRDITTRLVGEGAEADISGMWYLDCQKEIHTNVHVEHVAPHCQSLQLFKGAVGDEARSSFQGKIYVRKEAQKTESYQLNNNLILGDHAEANAKPNLEIFADDVKASHGATVGQLSSDELFYLKSRGLNEKDARGCLIWAFCKEVVAKLASNNVQSEVEKRIKNSLL